MKNLSKFLLACLLLTCFSVVNASVQEINDAKSATEAYCEEDAPSKGCIYDKNNSLYSSSGYVYNENFEVSMSWNGVPLTRAYQAADANGNMVFAGCYRATNVDNHRAIDAIWWDSGTYFIFKIVEVSGKSCKATKADIVPAKDIGYHTLWGAGRATYTGQNGIGGEMATYAGWTAKNNGACPLYFGLTANSRWYTSNKNRYLFTDTPNSFTIETFSFWGNEKYGRNPGCTVQDIDGHAEAQKCFDGAKDEIQNYTCPLKFEDFASLTEKLAPFQTKCDNKFSELYSKGLLVSDANKFKTQLKEAANAKIDECYANHCNVNVDKFSEAYAKIKADSTANCDTTACKNKKKSYYTAAGFTTTQINCLLNNEEAVDDAKDDVAADLDQQFEDQVAEELQDNVETREEIEKLSAGQVSVEAPDFDISEEPMTCDQILGPKMTPLISGAITAVQIVCAIIAIVNAMIKLIPAVMSKDADALKTAQKKCITMAIVLAIVCILRPIIRLIGMIFGFDFSCL